MTQPLQNLLSNCIVLLVALPRPLTGNWLRGSRPATVGIAIISVASIFDTIRRTFLLLLRK